MKTYCDDVTGKQCNRFNLFKKAHFSNTQKYDGAQNFATDAWTSPNSKAYVAMTVHFENASVPILMLLDIIEVMCLNSGFNLAATFVKILDEFGINDKASDFSYEKKINSPDKPRFSQ